DHEGDEMARKLGMALLGALTALALTAGAAHGTAQATGPSSAATLTVDNDRKDCPNADYTRIRDAIGAAHEGDTIVVCAGTYVEGPGAVGSNGLQITKSLTIRGAGADKVTIEPNGGKEHRIAETNPDLRDGKGAIGLLVDAATSDYSPSGTTPLQASGVPIHAILTSDQIAGRNSCQNYNDPAAGGPTVIDGDCQASGGSNPIPPPLPLTTGPLFG